MTSRKGGGRAAYHLGLFLAVSVLCGLLVACIALPFATMLTRGVRTGAQSLEQLPAELTIGPQSERSRVLMSDGSTLAEFYAEDRTYVPLSKIAPIMRVAQVAIEDDRFYQHGAIDLRGTARAALRSASGTTQGGSTLTQQYVKQVQIEAAKGDPALVKQATAQTMARKIKELRYAVAVEKRLTKDQILERYLNIAYYGDGAYGVEAAAHHYFNVTAAQLTLPQAAMLAGLVQNPVSFEPVHHPAAGINRRNVVLARMATLGRITPAQAAAARKVGFDQSRVQGRQNGCVSSPFPTLCLYVTRVLTSNQFPSLGKTADERLDTLRRGGLTIRTQISRTAQQAAEDAVARRVSPTDPYIGVAVLMQPKSGLIVSMGQSRPKIGTGPGQTWYNYAVDRAHGGAEGYQAGSTFKAFTMAAALAKGMTPSQTYDAKPTMDYSELTYRSCTGTFRPASAKVKNSTGHDGSMNMISAAMWSVNTYFIQLESAAGLCDVVKTAKALGVQRADGKDLINDPAPLANGGYDNIASFTLGSVEVTPLSMAEAYATFANRGIHCNPIIIQSITTKAGKSLPVPSANCKRVMDPAVADAVSYILQQVIERGTALPAHLSDDRDQAGKTGTIDGAEAVWLAGYTPDLAGVSMIAVDKLAPQYLHAKRTLTDHRSYGTDCGSDGCELQGSGGQDAGKIWRVAMDGALANVAPSRFVAPSSTIMLGRMAELPDISRLDEQDAKAAIIQAGFSYTEVQKHDNSVEGTYLGAYPSSGTFHVSTVVQLMVSSGPAPAPSPTPTPSTSRRRTASGGTGTSNQGQTTTPGGTSTKAPTSTKTGTTTSNTGTKTTKTTKKG